MAMANPKPPKVKTAKIKCPSCGQEYTLEVGAAATTYRCAVCKAEFTAE